MVVKLAVFDCDGTLMDSQHNIVAAMDECFRRNGLEPPHANRTRRVVGLSLPQAMATLHPDGDDAFHAHLAEDYKSCFKAMRSDDRLAHEALYDGALDAMERLEAAGWLLAVATGKSDRGLRYSLEFHEIFDRFVSLQTADRHPSKPHPAMLEQAMQDAGAEAANSLMIGDTVFDIEMAANAGVPAIGVAWGYHEPDELHAAGAEHVADDYPALGDYILSR